MEKKHFFWLVNICKVNMGSKSVAFDVSICEESHNVCKIALSQGSTKEFMKLFVLRDFYFNPNDDATENCEESERCLDLTCKYNNTTAQSYSRGSEIGKVLIENDEKKLKTLLERISKVNALIKDNEELLKDIETGFKKKGETMILYEKPIIIIDFK